MSDNMDKLKELTSQLPSVPSLIELDNRTGRNYVVYETECGDTIGLGLLKDDHIAVQRAFINYGATFPEHAHEADEHLIVYRGKLVVNVPDAEITVGAGKAVHIPPNTPHSVHALENTWLIGITIPPMEGYPDD